MSVRVTRGRSDKTVTAIARLLERYDREHPGSRIEVYRKNHVSVRVRVVDPAFRGLSRSQRARMVWPLLRELPDETLTEVSMVLLLSPEERRTSSVSLEFDHPSPSRL